MIPLAHEVERQSFIHAYNSLSYAVQGNGWARVWQIAGLPVGVLIMHSLRPQLWAHCKEAQ